MMNNLRIISKISPIFCSNPNFEEYIISDDFFYPFSYLDNYDLFNSSFCRTERNYKNSSAQKESTTDIYNFCSCFQSLAFVKFNNSIGVKIDAILFSIIMIELGRSRTFRINFLHNFYAQYIEGKNVNILDACDSCQNRKVLIHVIVYLRPPKKNLLDYKWNGRVQVLVNEKCDLENAMAWLSTLGGAFSALGDTYVECAKRAGVISVQQLSIALRLGDPLTVCRCKIYLAMSLLQRGYFRKTKCIIRDLYRFSTEGEGSKDFRLKNMCIAVWNRLKYLKSQKAIKNQ